MFRHIHYYSYMLSYYNCSHHTCKTAQIVHLFAAERKSKRKCPPRPAQKRSVRSNSVSICCFLPSRLSNHPTQPHWLPFTLEIDIQFEPPNFYTAQKRLLVPSLSNTDQRRTRRIAGRLTRSFLVRIWKETRKISKRDWWKQQARNAFTLGWDHVNDKATSDKCFYKE